MMNKDGEKKDSPGPYYSEKILSPIFLSEGINVNSKMSSKWINITHILHL